jgi:prephenate dehydratase
MRVAYLGPAGTFTEDALRAAGGGGHEAVLTTTVPEAIEAVREGRADRALVPFENSIEGSVRPSLDTLAQLAGEVAIVGEHDHPVRVSLIARREVGLGAITEVISHPQPLAQCARFLRAEIPGAKTRAVESTAEAVRLVSESEGAVAALGARSAADLYGCAVLREGVEDEGGNVTRFVWIAPVGTRAEGEGPWKTSLVFAELGEDHPGALVDALVEFSSRGVNLIRIESRPRRKELGRYRFFVDAEGSLEDEAVAAAVEGLRSQAESVDILGSYPVAAPTA